MPGHKIDKIISELQEIHALKLAIQTRVCSNSSIIKDTDGVALSKININLKIKLIAQQLKDEHPELNPMLIFLLDGGMPFGMELSKELHNIGYNHSWTAMSVSSYGNSIKSSGEVQISSAPKSLLGARNVILVDDICETGHTYVKTREKILSLGASSVQLIVLVDKKEKRPPSYAEPLYACFTVDDGFLIGMGLDYMGGGGSRGMPSVNVVDMSSLATEDEMQILGREKELNQMLIAALAEKQLEKAEQQTLCSSNDKFSFGGQPKDPVVKDLNANVASSSLS